MKYVMKSIISAFVFVLFSGTAAFMPGPDAGEPPKRVAILPFTLNAPQNLDYLRDGILDMLATRLYWKDKVVIIEKAEVKKAMADHQGAVDRQYAEQLGRQLGVDYVLFGSVTLFGDSMSVDATMESITGKEAPVTVYSQTKGMESVIPEINTFAQKINAELFARPEATAQVAAPTQPQPVPATPMTATPPGWTASPLNPAFMQHQRLSAEEGSFWRSHTLYAEVTGMDIGDVDGDGQNEMVLMEGSDVVVYRYQDQRILKLAAFSSPDKERFIAVDVADINQNGRAEIFASKVRGTIVTSYVLEMENGKLKPLVKDASWFYRVMDWPGKGRVLLGQEKMMGSIGGGLASTYFRKGIERLAWNGSDYVPSGEGPVLDLKGVYIYNFAIGDLTGDSVPEIVRIDKWGNLHIMDRSGENLYKTNEAYGGTLNAILTNPEAPETFGPEQTYLYIPARIVIADLDKDGRNEIIINQNHSSIGNFSERFKAYSDGKMVSLSWNGLSLNSNWESQKLNGTLSDYQIKDLDNDGQVDLVVAMLKQRGASMFRDSKSVVVSYRLNLEKQDQRSGIRGRMARGAGQGAK